MQKIVVSILNGLLAEAITTALSDSGEFQPFRISVSSRKSEAADSCRMMAADLILMEVAYAGGTSVETRLREAKEVREAVPGCKIVFLCDENTSPDIAREVMLAKKDGLIDGFFYSSVTIRYLLAALISL
jgi:DNA-binding NarL/FixJ family response regulator